jgi:hypothetical protein
VNKGAKDQNRQFSKVTQMANKYMKKCSTSFAIKGNSNQKDIDNSHI